MSKRGQQFGSPPCKIRVEGEEGFKPEQRLMLEQLQGVISKFYAGCVQQQQLSEQPGYKQIKALANGVQLRYAYNGGQETIDVRMSPKTTTSEEKQEDTKTDGAWDWLVVDIELPTYNTAMTAAGRRVIQRLNAAARFYKPGLPDIPDPANPPTEANPNPPPLFSSLERIAIDRQNTGTTQQEPGSPPRLLWGFASAAQQIGGEDIAGDPNNIHRCSLLVDIRPFAQLDVIQIDVWGILDMRELDKTLHTVVTKALGNGSSSVQIKGQYTGGTAGRTYIETTYPSIASTITSWHSRSLSYLNNYFMPQGISSSADDNIITNADNYSPTGLADNSAEFQTWYFNNSDIFNDPLWEQGYSAQWADVSPPYSWTGGSWTSGHDMAAYLGALDAAPMPSSESFSGMLSELGVKVNSISGSEFWWQWNDHPPGLGLGDPDGFDFGGNGDPGTPPANNYGWTSGAYACGYAFAAVRNAYIYQPKIQVPPSATTHQENVSFKVAALKGNFLNPPEDPDGDDKQLVWSERKPDYNDLFVALDPTTGNVWRYGQWEEKGQFPQRWSMSELGSAQDVLVTNQDVLENAAVDYGQFLGRITFDQTGGGQKFSWKPAADIEEDQLPVMPA